MIDLKIPAEYWYHILDAGLKQVNDHTIEDTANSKQPGYGLKTIIRTTPSILRSNSINLSKNFGAWINEDIICDKNEVSAQKPSQMGCFVEFDTKSNPVLQVQNRNFICRYGRRS